MMDRREIYYEAYEAYDAGYGDGLHGRARDQTFQRPLTIDAYDEGYADGVAEQQRRVREKELVGSATDK